MHFLCNFVYFFVDIVMFVSTEHNTRSLGSTEHMQCSGMCFFVNQVPKMFTCLVFYSAETSSKLAEAYIMTSAADCPYTPQTSQMVSADCRKICFSTVTVVGFYMFDGPL